MYNHVIRLQIEKTDKIVLLLFLLIRHIMKVHSYLV